MRLNKFLDKKMHNKYNIIIVDGKSTDETPNISRKLAKNSKKVSYVRTGVAGKGAQLKKAALSLKGDYFIFIDADLPIKLEEFLQICNSLMNNEADLVIASRYLRKTEIKRSLVRIVFSKLYSIAIQIWFRAGIKDTIAGCKAWNKKIQKNVWPKIKDKKWFFDTELIYLALKKRYKIKQIAVSYSDRGDSKFSALKDGLVIATNLVALPFRYKNEI
jgi:glycosyltransferase involved in cell wall biosynthesis